MTNFPTTSKTARKTAAGTRRFRLIAAPLLALTTLLSGVALAPAAQAAPAHHITATTTTDGTATKNTLNNLNRGSMFDFKNETGAGINVAGEQISYGYAQTFQGKNSDNDWSGQVHFRDGTSIDLHANNPATSEAYFQVGPHKVYREAHLKWNGKHFHVKYMGPSYEGKDGQLYQFWKVTCTGDNGFYSHEFIHHLDAMDGVKGTITNTTQRDVIVKAGGANTVLTPGQRMVYYDAGFHGYGHGTHMQVLRPGTDKATVDFKAMDPSIGYPKVDVVTGDGHKDSTLYSVNQAMTFTDRASDFNVTIKRQGDHKLPTIYERSATSDWAVFDLDITDK